MRSISITLLLLASFVCMHSANPVLSTQDYSGKDARIITGDIMTTANFLFKRHIHEIAELNAAEAAKLKSDTIQQAIDRYLKFEEEMGQKNHFNAIPPKGSQP
uniref:Uncharacterized protein n=1 Tax=Clytia hemisphaerica TaxID=252671 RepID=A0A7M5X6H8_9CNID